MISLDLRIVVFGAAALIVLIVVAAIWFDRRFWRSRFPRPFTPVTDSSESRIRPFLNDLAHELRTPLAVLLTHLEIQRSATVPTETKQESIRLMQAEARRMSQMVSNILELGELEAQGLTMLRPVNLNEVAANVLQEMLPLAQESEINLTLNSNADALWVNGDELRLKQVLLNLVENALKYSRAHDRVQIILERDHGLDKILCAVCDTGPGISPEHLPHVKRRFYRGTSEEIGGSGLGLALVDTILQLHDSALKIESNTRGEKTGTCVRFALAIAAEMENEA